MQVLTRDVDVPIWLIRRGVDIRSRLFNEFDQTTLETQPLALKRISTPKAGTIIRTHHRTQKTRRIEGCSRVIVACDQSISI